MSNKSKDDDVVTTLWVVCAIMGFVFVIDKILTAPPDVHVPPPVPTVQTTCHGGQVWTSHYFRGSNVADNMILVNGQPVDCK